MNIARLIHPGFWFDKTPLEQALALAKRGVGGFCIYGGTRQRVTEFTQAVRRVSPVENLLISADYEDGLGRWLPDAPLLPSNMALGAANDENLAYEKGVLTAQQARSLGVDWVFAPVLDLADNALNPIVNTRAFSNDPQQVIRLARAFLRGLNDGGVLSSIKHCPGHGDTTTDSHVSLPVLHKTKEQLLARELKPFAALLNETDSVMFGHLLIPEIDADNPASLSPEIVKKIVREQFRYDGCILTDALLMKAIGDEKTAALKALHAGADILLVPQNPDELIDFLEKADISPELISRALRHQDTLCKKIQTRPAMTSPVLWQTDFPRHTAQKAIVKRGNLSSFKPGQTVSYIVVGDDGKTSVTPLLNTLKKNGVNVIPFTERAENLLIICLRRYQAFAGKIALEENDIVRLKNAVENAENCVSVLLASPWALPKELKIKTSLYTFSPAPEFQETAAEILLGQRTAQGSLPVTL